MTAPRAAAGPRRTVVAVVGPTATGKSDLAVSIAEALGGEIVNADSMQVYRGMDIGTAKLPPEGRRGIPHHLLDVWPARHEVSVAEFQELGRAAIDGIRDRGRTPVVVGGSGLYVAALIDDLRFPGTDPQVRARLEADLASLGAAAMHERLAVVDPAAAGAILPGNGRRIVRALEVVEITGEPFAATMSAGPAYPCVRIGLSADWPILDERIARRVERMGAEGLVDEVRALRDEGMGRTSSRALGYRQVLEMLDGGCDEATAMESIVVETRRFARRQLRWFRRDPLIAWIDAGSAVGHELLDEALRRVANPPTG